MLFIHLRQGWFEMFLGPMEKINLEAITMCSPKLRTKSIHTKCCVYIYIYIYMTQNL